MKLGKFSKSPEERKRYAINYTEWLDTGETLSDVVFTVAPSESNGLTVDASSISSDTLSVVFYVSDGNNGTQYSVTATASTSGGQTKQDTILFDIRAV